MRLARVPIFRSCEIARTQANINSPALRPTMVAPTTRPFRHYGLEKSLRLALGLRAIVVRKIGAKDANAIAMALTRPRLVKPDLREFRVGEVTQGTAFGSFFDAGGTARCG